MIAHLGSSRVERIVEIIQEVSNELDVFAPRGQGDGNRVTNAAVRKINELVAAELGYEVTQCVLCAGNKQSVDFFLREEGIVVELEYSLRNPYPCLEKDLFKVFLAKDSGINISELVLVGDPGCAKRMAAPAPRAIIDFAQRAHGVRVRVIELNHGGPFTTGG